MQTVRSACKLPPDARSEETVDEIVEFVKAGAKDAKFFSKVSPLLRRALCRMMQIQAFQPGSFAVDKDDLPDKYCIVFTGSVDLLQAPQQAEGRCPSGLHKEGSCECQKVFQKVLGVQAGGSFGETVMQDELPKQNFAACCVEATELLVTKRSDFDLCSAQLHRQFIEQRVRFLRGFPRIEEALQYSLVTTQDISTMANCLTERSLSGNEIALRQGEMADNMIFVHKGQLAMIRVIDGDGAPMVQRTSTTVSRVKASDGLSNMFGKAILEHRRKRQTALEDLMRQGSKDDEAEADSPPPRGKPRVDRSLSMKSAKSVKSQKSGKLVKSVKSKESQKASPSDPEAGASDAAVSMATSRAASKTSKTSRKAADEEAEEETDKKSGKQQWGKLREAWKTGVRAANAAEAASDAIEEMKQHRAQAQGRGRRENDIADAERNVQQFKKVAEFRRQANDLQVKEIWTQRADSRKKREEERREEMLRKKASQAIEKAAEEAAQRSLLGLDAKAPKQPTALVDPESYGHLDDGDALAQEKADKGKRILRIGTVGAYQYFGDRQVCNAEAYNVTLVSDPVAEIYLLSKHDILRRLQKKIFPILFSPDQESVPSDQLLLDLHRQTERWNAFRGSMYQEVADRRNAGVPRPLRDPAGPNQSRVDVVANLAFLGVHPDIASSMARREANPNQQPGQAHLRVKDQEYFSHASARFLRKCDEMKNDPGLHAAIVKAGTKGGASPLDEEERDPNMFHFEQQWSKLRKMDGLDLEVQEDEELLAGRNDIAPPGGQTRWGSHGSDQGRSPSRRGSASGAPGLGLSGHGDAFAALAGSKKLAAHLPRLGAARPSGSQSARVEHAESPLPEMDAPASARRGSRSPPGQKLATPGRLKRTVGFLSSK